MLTGLVPHFLLHKRKHTLQFLSECCKNNINFQETFRWYNNASGLPDCQSGFCDYVSLPGPNLSYWLSMAVHTKNISLLPPVDHRLI